ncbi:hypothetical protein DERF_012173 [Dermatophagoides farinae]|uniref:Uncharacterized protein n=1 Tax=Dermatophagoides farinae TaxID=6954 RepID=A0A922KWW7_DERFA|nr:hypothetical protein DERF_012173 [Dermatophagoides farinae]
MLHNNQLISIEEILVKPPQNCRERPLRQFILFNRNSDLKICIYTLGARVMSCMLNEHQIIVGAGGNSNGDNNIGDNGGNRNNDFYHHHSTSNNLEQSDDDNRITTTMITAMDDIPIIIDRNMNNNNNNGQNPLQNVCWDSHVFGSDTVLLNHRLDSMLFGPKQTLTYCLTKNNEFIIEGSDIRRLQNLRSLLINPFFFNLNSVENDQRLDEHYLHIRTSHDSINVFSEQTNNNNNDDSSDNHIGCGNDDGNNPLYERFLHPSRPTIITQCLDGSDFVYSTNPSTIPGSLLIATLQYKNRIIEILLEIDSKCKSSLRILIKNGSIAFIPHEMSKFKVTYRFHW